MNTAPVIAATEDIIVKDSRGFGREFQRMEKSHGFSFLFALLLTQMVPVVGYQGSNVLTSKNTGMTVSDSSAWTITSINVFRFISKSHANLCNIPGLSD